jgi:MFS family permease
MLATALCAVASSGVAEALVTRIGPKHVLAAGLALMGGALVWFAQIPVHGGYVNDLLGPLLLMGLGTGFAFVPISIVALAGVPERQSGLASGLMNTTQQVGGAVGLAVASTVFATRLAHQVPHLIEQGVPPRIATPQAMVSGFTLAYWVLAVVAFVGAALAVALLRGVHLGAPEAQPVETHVVSPFCFNRAATSAISAVVLGDGAPEAPIRTS